MKSALPTLVSFLTAISLLGAPARAHSWYPKECCTGKDCAPVEKVTWLVPTGGALPQLVVTSTLGTAVVPHDLPVRKSEGWADARLHPRRLGGLPLHPATNVANGNDNSWREAPTSTHCCRQRVNADLPLSNLSDLKGATPPRMPRLFFACSLVSPDPSEKSSCSMQQPHSSLAVKRPARHALIHHYRWGPGRKTGRGCSPTSPSVIYRSAIILLVYKLLHSRCIAPQQSVSTSKFRHRWIEMPSHWVS